MCKVRIYSLDDNDQTNVYVRKLDSDDMEVVEWRKPRAKVGALVVDIKSPQGFHLTTFDLADFLRLAREQFPEEFEELVRHEAEEPVSNDLDEDDAAFAELLRLNAKIQKKIELAYEIARGNDDHAVWTDTYNTVFDGGLARKVRAQFDTLGCSFDPYIPDTSYQEDVTYYARGLRDRVDELKPQHPEVSSD